MLPVFMSLLFILPVSTTASSFQSNTSKALQTKNAVAYCFVEASFTKEISRDIQNENRVYWLFAIQSQAEINAGVCPTTNEVEVRIRAGEYNKQVQQFFYPPNLKAPKANTNMRLKIREQNVNTGTQNYSEWLLLNWQDALQKL